MAFSQIILHWHSTYGRHDLPWNQTDNPYHIWVSEIILQQTRVETGIRYFQNFIKEFPDVEALAHASLDKVLKQWEGMGYYSRARNLHKGAIYVVDFHQGTIPSTPQELLKIPGIGPYTSAAIASFAFGKQKGVVDGNIMRVLTRFLGIEESIQSTRVQRNLQEIADQFVPKNNSASYNKGIMDLGATICLPKSPKCLECPIQEDCKAYHYDIIDRIPFKPKKVKVKERTIHLLMDIDGGGDLIVTKREQDDIWKGLYFLPELNKMECHEYIEHTSMTHLLTHRKLYLHFYVKKNDKTRREKLKKAIIKAQKEKVFPRPLNKLFEHMIDE